MRARYGTPGTDAEHHHHEATVAQHVLTASDVIPEAARVHHDHQGDRAPMTEREAARANGEAELSMPVTGGEPGTEAGHDDAEQVDGQMLGFGAEAEADERDEPRGDDDQATLRP